MPRQPNYSIFYKQDSFPEDFARNLSYEQGFAAGVEATDGGDISLRGLLVDTYVLSRRYPLPVAARLLWLSEPGLRGFLDAADWRPEDSDPGFRTDSLPRP